MHERSRKKLRLREFDYSSAGYYYVTICVKEKEKLLWKHNLCSRGAQCAPAATASQPPARLQDNAIPSWSLSEAGCYAEDAIRQIHVHYPDVYVDQYAIMPNHIHLILVIRRDTCAGGTGGRTLCAPTPPTISQVVRMMKCAVTKRLGYAIWQKSFYDHIIRNEPDYRRICQYIDTNPSHWEEDEYYKG